MHDSVKTYATGSVIFNSECTETAWARWGSSRHSPEWTFHDVEGTEKEGKEMMKGEGREEENGKGKGEGKDKVPYGYIPRPTQPSSPLE